MEGINKYELELDIPKMCRVCLLQKEKLNNIYSNCIVEGYILSLPVIIKSCLDLHLNQEDENLPRKICDTCKIQVINFYSFKDKCKKAEQALNYALNKSKIIKEEASESQDGELGTKLDDEINSDVHSEAEYLIDMKLESDDNIETELVHSYDDGDTNDTKSVKTGKEELQNEIIDNNGNIQHNNDDDNDSVDDLLLQISVSKNNDKTVFPKCCEICQKQFETINNLQRHMETHTGIHYKCRICAKVYLHQASRNRHMREIHPEQVQELLLQKETPFARNDPKNPPIQNKNESNEGLLENDDETNELNFETDKIEYEMQNSNDYDDDDILSDEDDNGGTFDCNICGKLFTSNTLLLQHTTLCHEFFCNKCFKIFTSKESYENHVRNDHKISEISQPISSVNSTLFCFYCQKKLRSSSEFDTHKKLHESMSVLTALSLNIFTCYKCNTMYIEEEDLKKHELKHTHQKYVDDRSCTDYQFLEDDIDMDGDNTNNSKILSFKCGICHVEMTEEESIKNHVILHSRKFACPFEGCGCEYNRFSRLSLHMISKHLHGSQHICVHCSEEFSTYDDLQTHIKKNCPEKKFDCNHCDKKFFSRKALYHHQKNSKEKKFMCQFCGKSFSQQGELTIHNRSHTGERPFQCTICGKAYKTSSMRTAHMDAHIEGKTFPCTMCDKKLQTRTSFRNHMKRHTEDKKHECEICLRKFFTKYHVKLHTMRIHNNPKKSVTKKVTPSIVMSRDMLV